MEGPWKFGDVIQVTDRRVTERYQTAVVIDRGSRVSGPGNTWRYRAVFMLDDGQPSCAWNICTDEGERVVEAKSEEETIAVINRLREAEEARWANSLP